MAQNRKILLNNLILELQNTFPIGKEKMEGFDYPFSNEAFYHNCAKKSIFSNTRWDMRSADEHKPVNLTCATLTFVEPTEMLHFLSAAKIKLIKLIRNHPDTVTRIT